MKWHRLSLLLLLGLGLVPRTALPEDNPPQGNLEAALNSQYHDKIMALRHPLEKETQLYDADGTVLKGGHEGSWTTHGRILIKKVRMEKNSLLIEGHRVFYIQSGSSLAPFSTRENVKLRINLSQPAASSDEANAVLGHIFAFTEEERIESAPAFWQRYMAKQSRQKENENPLLDESSGEKKPGMIKEVEIDAAGNPTSHTELVKLGQGTTAPKPRYTPEPEYSDFARSRRYRGVLVMEMIVDATGKVRRPEIVRPLGMGLDENAVSKVLTWRFDPAQKDNQPVAVLLRIEVAFNSY